jgi:hypothetical protein
MSKSAKKQPASLTAALPAKPGEPAAVSSKGKRADPGTNKSDAGSKQSRIIAMLQSPAGATMDAMMKVTGWQQHSVRGFLAGVVRKRLKLKLGSRKVDGTRVYNTADADSGKPRSGLSKRRTA